MVKNCGGSARDLAAISMCSGGAQANMNGFSDQWSPILNQARETEAEIKRRTDAAQLEMQAQQAANGD